MINLSNLTARELASKHAVLMDEIEKLPPGSVISSGKKKKIEAMEKELRKRLYQNLSSDVLPIVITPYSKPKYSENEAMITFNFEAFSSLNTKIDRFKVDAPTKVEAWKEARKKAKKYPGDVNLKIS